MSTLYVDNLQPNLGSRVMAAGHVVQTVYVEETGTYQYATASDFDLFSASITPTATSSKILISLNLQWSVSNSNGDFGLYLKRGSTRIGGKTNDASRGGSNIWFGNDDRIGAEAQNNYNLLNASWQYLDNPNSTVNITYTVGVYVATQFSLNRMWGSTNGGTSSITLMEIAQ